MRKIPLFKISSTKNDKKYVNRIIDEKSNWAAGSIISKFENEISKINNSKYAVTFNSGTSALIAMYEALNLKGSEIIAPSFTFIATVNAILLAGAKVKFCDIEKDTYGIDFESFKKSITKKTKAVVLMHYSGCPARDTKKISTYCKKNKIHLLEDNSHSYGAKILKKNSGTFGIASAISFCQNKLISTGEGGAVVTDDYNIYKKLNLIRSHGRLESAKDNYFSKDKSFDYILLGYNFRMPSMNAALGISQIKYSYKKNIKQRIKNASYMNFLLSKNKDIITPITPKFHEHFYQQYTIRLINEASLKRDKLKNYLNSIGIACRVYYESIHQKTYYLNLFKGKIKLPNTEDVSKTILTLPMYPDLNKKEIDFISKKILEFLK